MDQTWEPWVDKYETTKPGICSQGTKTWETGKILLPVICWVWVVGFVVVVVVAIVGGFYIKF